LQPYDTSNWHFAYSCKLSHWKVEFFQTLHTHTRYSSSSPIHTITSLLLFPNQPRVSSNYELWSLPPQRTRKPSSSLTPLFYYSHLSFLIISQFLVYFTGTRTLWNSRNSPMYIAHHYFSSGVRSCASQRCRLGTLWCYLCMFLISFLSLS